MKTVVRGITIMAMTIMLVTSLIPMGAPITTEAATTYYYVITTPAGLNVRSGPGTQYKKLSTIPGGVVVHSNNDKKNGWIFISSDSHRGWVSQQYCKRVESYNDYINDIRRGVVVHTNGSRLNLRSGPSERFGIVTKIPNGASLSPGFVYNGWCSVLYKGKYYGWVSMTYIRKK